MMRDDEMYNANIGVFFDAPSVNHEDYYQFELLKHMIGDYEIGKHAEHLNDVGKQYNATHSLLGDLPDVTKQSSHYFAYSDCGIWGSYLFGNEIFVRQMNWVGLAAPVHYGEYVTEAGVVRGRNAMWNGLMREQTAAQINSEIGSPCARIGTGRPEKSTYVSVQSTPRWRYTVASMSWGVKGRSVGYSALAFVAPTTWPVLNPPPETSALYACGQWSRPTPFAF